MKYTRRAQRNQFILLVLLCLPIFALFAIALLDHNTKPARFFGLISVTSVVLAWLISFGE